MNKQTMTGMPKTMRAAILTQLRAPLGVLEVTMPETLAVGQVLVKVHYSGICGSQIGEIDGAKGEDKYLPHLLGHEASGTVIDVGPGVRHVAAGDTVVLHWRKGIGIDAEPARFSCNGEKINAGSITTFSEYAIVSENRLTPIVQDSDLQVAALFGCAVTTGFGVVENNAKVRIGESAVVYGAGGVGLNIVQALALVTAYPIIAVDIYENKLELAKKMGATHVVNAKNAGIADIQKIIFDIAGPVGIDVFIDNTGQPSVIEMGYQIVKPQGRVTLVGVPKIGRNVNIYTLPLHFGKGFSGSEGGASNPTIDIPRYHRLFSQGRILLKELITGCYSLDQINVALDAMRDGALSGRCLIAMGEIPSS